MNLNVTLSRYLIEVSWIMWSKKKIPTIPTKHNNTNLPLSKSALVGSIMQIISCMRRVLESEQPDWLIDIMWACIYFFPTVPQNIPYEHIWPTFGQKINEAFVYLPHRRRTSECTRALHQGIVRSIYSKKKNTPTPQKLQQKVFQRFLVVFDLRNNVLKVDQNQRFEKLLFSRWRPRWPPDGRRYLEMAINHLLSILET